MGHITKLWDRTKKDLECTTNAVKNDINVLSKPRRGFNPHIFRFGWFVWIEFIEKPLPQLQDGKLHCPHCGKPIYIKYTNPEK